MEGMTMAKKQSRRSISISAGAYEKLRAYCNRKDIPMSQFVENLTKDMPVVGAAGAAGIAGTPPCR
jgi:hypothetical protein